MKIILPVGLTLAVCALAPVHAWNALPAKNEATLARSFALPALGQSQLLAPDEQSLQLNLDVITEYYTQGNARESIVVDGETTQLGLRYRRGLADDLELSVNVPVLIVGGGFMDRFIQDWHRVFGLPNGGREAAPNDRRLYRYTRDGVTLLNETSSTTTVGDTQLGIGWQYSEHLALHGMVSVPTGDRDRLTGGTLGAAGWADWQLPFAQNSAFDGFVSGGVSLSRNQGALSSLRETAVLFGGAGLGYQLTENLEAVGQLGLHSPLYKDSDLDGLSNPGLQLTLGGRYRITPAYNLEMYFQEDPITSSSPDFSIHIGLTVR